MPHSLLWLRRDLRISDNPALIAALQSVFPLIVLYIYNPDATPPMGEASKVWLHHSLNNLNATLKKMGGKLVLLKGNPKEIIKDHLDSWQVESVYFNRIHEPQQIIEDDDITTLLRSKNIKVHQFEDGLISPKSFFNKQGGPYKVFTPFYNQLMSCPPPALPSPPPSKITFAKIKGIDLDSLDLMPHHPWAKNMMAHWKPGENGAHEALDLFRKASLDSYPKGRDYPADDGSSRLSPHLHFGEISVREAWHVIGRTQSPGTAGYLRELAWREFAIHLLFHFPHTANQPLNPLFKKMPWKKNKRAFDAWKKGLTGYPIVDAGMRELWATGFMHNRVRMIVGSFLIKDFLINWTQGFNWFWETLVDADLASNALNWQWVAGCGADAAPFFRIFNPVLQSQRFDPKGIYIKKWVPELQSLNEKEIHTPWNSNVKYPQPIINHDHARKLALEIYKNLKN